MIKGNLGPVIQRYKEDMKLYSEQLEFEKAAMIKGKLEGLENYQARSVIVSKTLSNVDVFSILREKDTAYINYLDGSKWHDYSNTYDFFGTEIR